MKLYAKIFGLIAVCGMLSATSAQYYYRTEPFLQFGLNAGMAHIVDEEMDEWNIGFNVGANGFFLLNPMIGLGARINYNRFSPDNDDWIEMVQNLTNGDVEGALHVLEISPALRLMTASIARPWNFFFQAATGLEARFSEITVSGDLFGTQTEIELEDKSERNFTLGLGAGIMLGDIKGFTLELFPEYHMTFPRDENIEYYTVDLGLTMRF